MQPEVDSDRLGVWGTSFSGGHVIHVAAHDSRVKAVVSQVGAMNPGQIFRDQAKPEQFAAFQQMLVKERVRHATDGGDVYIPSAAPPDQGFALQNDQDSYNFGHDAQKTIAPSWRNQITMSSLETILEHAPGKSIELIAPRPLLMILAKGDTFSPPDSIRTVFSRAGEPKRLLEVEGGHYTVYRGMGADQASRAAVDWFTKYLLQHP